MWPVALMFIAFFAALAASDIWGKKCPPSTQEWTVFADTNAVCYKHRSADTIVCVAKK